ncbi:hypothetical protein J6590_047674 [Homalodisca vitripennis]|nr:hypothetical protein J6590_047674 [Homalodisca vitripennis]
MVWRIPTLYIQQRYGQTYRYKSHPCTQSVKPMVMPPRSRKLPGRETRRVLPDIGER